MHDHLRITLLSPPTFWRCEPSWSWTSRPLADHLLWCVLDGRGRLELNGATQELHPGVCAVFAPGDAPRATHDPRRRLLVFGMHFEVDPTAVTQDPRWGEVMDRELLGVLARTSDASYRRQDALGRRQAELCLEQLLGVIWDAVHNPGRRATDAAVDEVARQIRQDPGHGWTISRRWLDEPCCPGPSSPAGSSRNSGCLPRSTSSSPGSTAHTSY